MAMAQSLSQTEVQRLVTSDNAQRGLGYAVALSGDRALIGARNSFNPESFGGRFDGAAYVYELDEAGTWVQVAKLAPPDRARDKQFGFSVALSGDRALVGTRGADAVFVFEPDASGTWVQVARLTASDAPDTRLGGFGYSVSLQGDRALVGDIANDHAGRSSGAAYVYERNRAGTWIEVTRLTASDAAQQDGFGRSVSLSGDRALIGASGKNDAGSQSGVAYVYERDVAGTWAQGARLTASDAAAQDFFGNSVALSGDRLLIGSLFNNAVLEFAPGAAYVYERDGAGMWVQVAKLAAPGPLEDFGNPVALAGDRALVGAIVRDDALTLRAEAYLYERDGTGMWVQAANLVGSDANPLGNRFLSAALSGDRVLLGAGDLETAYVFRLAAGNDADQDGVVDAMDNCPFEWNPRQEDFDQDRLGDACDLDDDDGVDDADDLFPLDPDRTLLPLILGQVDSTDYGFRFENTFSHRAVLERQFEASGSDLRLTLTGFDIDTATEVRVLVNGVRIGFLSRSPDNGRATTQLPIPKRLLDSTGNTLRFEQANPRWRWGVTDLLLSEVDPLPPLIIDQVDSAEYGYRFAGINSHRDVLVRQFDASGSDLVLTLTGYDIDFGVEVRVLINDVRIGFLARTPNNGRGISQLTIARSLLDGAGNTVRFEQVNPGWRWGVTDLVLTRAAGR